MKKRLLSVLLVLALALSLTACGAGAFEVRFELNGGELVSGALLQVVAKGAAAEAPEVKREGYVFDGWSEDFSAVSADMVAAAKWVREPEPSPEPAVYEVRFELCGGELVSGALLQRVEEGAAAEAPEIKREGYVFDGWSEDFPAVSGNLITAAKWVREPEPSPAPAIYEVRFELNGGELVSGRLLQQVEEGAAAEAPEVKREGYAFDGWNENVRDVHSNLVAAAMWKHLYSVRFDAAGGEILSGETEQLVAEGEYPEPPELKRSNYAFSGWDRELDPVSGDAVYTAEWKAVELRSEEVFSKIAPAVVEIQADEANGVYYSLGSGFFIDDQGTLITNYHVIDGAVSGQVSLTDGSVCAVLSVLGYDPALDIAVLKADISGNPYLTLADGGVSTGETIYALGSSEGLTSTFSSGNVSAASRVIEDVSYIQITAPISHGNSGGPLVNVFGEVVGINAMAYIEGQNLNFAIDIRELTKVDRSLALSLAEVCEIQYPNGYPDEPSGSEEGFYDVADYAEEESNDVFLLADRLENGRLLAGEVSYVGDMDWFVFTLDKPGDIDFIVAPGYIEDIDYLLCGVVRLTDNGDTEVIQALEPDSEDDFVFMSGTVRFDEPGDYFLVLLLDEGYPYDEPAYYFIDATW